MTEQQRAEVQREYVDDYLQHAGDPRWIRLHMGSWSDNARSWRTNPTGVPCLSVRYEDLKADTVAEVRRICEFLQINPTEQRIADAIEASSFASMRTMEEREVREQRPGFFLAQAKGAADPAGARFMNRGETGQARQRLSSEQFRRAVDVFRNAMLEFGYDPPEAPQ